MTESDDLPRLWHKVLAAGVRAQTLVPGSVAVGGTAAALYARHRFSYDTDHLVAGLRDRFDQIRQGLERDPAWKTARVQPPVLILGDIDGVQVGFRHPRRIDCVDTEVKRTEAGPLVVPTLGELIGMKAYLLYSRNALRDYLDFAALASCAQDEEVLSALLKTDAQYGHLQTGSVALEIAKRLTDPSPFDLSDIRLDEYKGVAPEWRSWNRVRADCLRFGRRLGEELVVEPGSP